MTSTEARGLLAQSLVVGLAGPEPTPGELELVADPGIGGVILFARNVEAPRQVWELNRRLQEAAARAERDPLFIMVDQEGGSVARLHEPFTDGPDMAEVGAGWGEAGAFDHGARMGAELAAAGFNWNLAPVLDVHGVAGGIMARRSLGSDPTAVAGLGAAYIKGLQSSGCLACAKHFPGLGRTTADTHAERPRVGLSRDELQAVELAPFRAALAVGVAGVMISHAVFEGLDPVRPASLSPAVIEGLLRDQLGFGGLVLSDDLEMGALAAELPADQAVELAYMAGCDLLLVCRRAELAVAGLERLVARAQAGELAADRVAASAVRIASVKKNLAPAPGPVASLTSLLGIEA